MLSREEKRHALGPIRDEGGSDAWATTIGHWFGVTETLYHAGECLPAQWEFRHGMTNHDPISEWHGWNTPCPHTDGRNWGTDEEPEYECQCTEERYYVPFLDAGERGIEMLRYAGNVLDRYASWLKRAGKDY